VSGLGIDRSDNSIHQAEDRSARADAKCEHRDDFTQREAL
jgi:hypothetical protein